MTTPKELEDLRVWLKEVIYAPQYAGKIINAVPKLIAAIEGNQKLAEEFRRLAAACRATVKACQAEYDRTGSELEYLDAAAAHQIATTWEQAAQMVEEKLNGDD